MEGEVADCEMGTVGAAIDCAPASQPGEDTGETRRPVARRQVYRRHERAAVSARLIDRNEIVSPGRDAELAVRPIPARRRARGASYITLGGPVVTGDGGSGGSGEGEPVHPAEAMGAGTDAGRHGAARA